MTWAQCTLPGYSAGDRQRRLPGGHPGAPVADVDVDQHVDRHAVGGGLSPEVRDVLGVVHDEQRVGGRRDELREPPDRGGRNDLGRDEKAADSGARHHLRLSELRARDAERPLAYLSAGDLGAAMRLRVGSEILACGARVRGHAAQVTLEAVEIEKQGRSRDVVARHRGRAHSTTPPLGRSAHALTGAVNGRRWRLRCWVPLVTSYPRSGRSATGRGDCAHQRASPRCMRSYAAALRSASASA
jgi:hypothetical protein